MVNTVAQTNFLRKDFRRTFREGTTPDSLVEQKHDDVLNNQQGLRHPSCMHDLNIPRSPTAAAVWLVNQTKDASTDDNDDPARTEHFFLASYQIIKPMFKSDDERALFLLTLREELDSTDFDWWNNEDSPAETVS